MALRGVLFDVDGTLVDSVYLHATCWAEALRQHDYVVPMARIAQGIGLGSDKLLPHMLGEMPDDADELVAAHDTLIRTHWERLKPLPGAADMVQRCAENGLVVVLASSASAAELSALRRVLDCDRWITAATSSADVDGSKPDPDLVQVALEKGGLKPADAVFVGDARWDVEAAGRAGVRCVGVASGVTGEEQLAAAGAVATYSDLPHLLQSFDTSPLGSAADG